MEGLTLFCSDPIKGRKKRKKVLLKIEGRSASLIHCKRGGKEINLFTNQRRRGGKRSRVGERGLKVSC